MTRIAIGRADLAAVEILDEPSPDLDHGQIRLTIDRFGLSANNISYAMTGDFLGYWAHFPVDDARGCVPVWGFADVAESRHGEFAVGERIFGYLPMGTELVVRPDAVTDLAFHDASDHRAALHPWYTRLYRCGADPAYDADGEGLQAIVWALFMTGWALADELAASARTVVASSASSKTALAMAWSLQQLDTTVEVVGLTSAANVDFVASTGVYDAVHTYDDLGLGQVAGPVAFVDYAGSQGLKERVHAALGERLADSVIVGGTHKGGEPGTGELSGPAPRFFFIPDVAEAAEGGHPAFHARFADALGRFSPWIAEHLDIAETAGIDTVVAAYRRLLSDNPSPNEGLVFTW
ncbi:MAG: DUF2855 family protein [Actinomycetota bacterium]